MNIDNCMKTYLIRSLKYEEAIEWIPFDRLSKVKEIGKGGFGSVYSALWAREPSSIVALKTLTCSMETKDDFLKEDKLEILENISDELHIIHDYTRYFHADFHGGNILQDQRSYIVDLGLSRPEHDGNLGDIYGVMPYVAPEVLLGEQKFTQEADIYGFGIIMSEMTTGQRPFDGHEFDNNLAIKICGGLQPAFAPGSPECYVELAKKCMNSNSQKRPKASDIQSTIKDWLNEIASSDDNEIKNNS
ncbi:kinase-like domain-containing protein [Gigaspora rosea]|uniref:Kinase-like domain-containing protein n=1 Tax=Gigaspora rosea TaxID=44941 RepID=A0A397VE78_9GLOM|nr:kinase-like domain-containing protein [Gigaspora rosea]